MYRDPPRTWSTRPVSAGELDPRSLKSIVGRFTPRPAEPCLATPVKHAASPDDPALADYWAQLRRKTPPPTDKTTLWLLKAQDGRCAICKVAFLPDGDRPQTPREWETWLTSARKTIVKVVTPQGPEPDEQHEPRLIHPRCRDGSDPALLPAYEPAGLA